MTQYNYREIQNRFTHIDAELAGYCFSSPHREDQYTVRFYPWWEHPAYLAARQNGQPWGFSDIRQGQVAVTVYPENTCAFRISILECGAAVTDWDFIEQHPLLWTYEEQVKITCNSRLTLDCVLGLIDLLRAASQEWQSPFEFLNFGGGFPQFMAWAQKGSFSLGAFPRSLLQPIYDYMNSVDAQLYPIVIPEPKYSPIVPRLLLLDGTDYIIADNFTLDIPEIIHKPEWFSPVANQ